MKNLIYSITILLSSSVYCLAQESISATLIDSTLQKPVPFATITLNNSYGVVSNSSGYFLLHFNKEITKHDSLFISCMGFETKHIALKNFKDSLITLNAKTFELNEVLITNENLTADEIISKVKENLNSNYDFDYLKSTVFYRESNFTNVLKKEVKIKKTTIPEFNQQFFDSITNSMPSKSHYYSELLGVKYRHYKQDGEQKLDILKASELYDKNNEITFNSFEERINSIIRKNVKPDSYFKIKSGVFGSKEEIDSTIFNSAIDKESSQFIEEQRKKEKAKKANFLRTRLNSMTKLEKKSLIFEESPLNFLNKSSKYKFELVDYVFLNEKYVYKISFTPKRNAEYKGVLYINLEDFAIERFDYENVKALKSFSLLGISYKYTLHQGTYIYTKNEKNKYVLKYAETVSENTFGVDRPLKIIEKNKHVKGRRKQNEISATINFTILNREKRELVSFESTSITKYEFNNFKEKANVSATYLPVYDPDFWKGYDVIEPNKAIKSFKSIESF